MSATEMCTCDRPETAPVGKLMEMTEAAVPVVCILPVIRSSAEQVTP